MSLVIFVSSKTVIISKYQLEFPFDPPPHNLTTAAITTYRLLRQSESIQLESTRDEREEAMVLLRHYGEALFQAIVPVSYRSRVYRSGGIFIYASDPGIRDLPWELLYDGSSFFAQTQGVIRINDSRFEKEPFESNERLPALKASLNSFHPSPPIPPGNRFISSLEELATATVNKSALLDFSINSNASQKSITESLANQPHLFMFSGHELNEGWVLARDASSQEDTTWFQKGLKPALTEAVSNGLKILILATSKSLSPDSRLSEKFLDPYFDLGIPYIITIRGRVARHRLLEYFQNLMIHLVREEPIPRSHRYAINTIHSSLPLSWDWSWIQLHLNKKLLEQSNQAALPPFRFNREREASNNQLSPSYSAINFHRFNGNAEILKRVTQRWFMTSNDEEILNIQTSKGMPQEEYLFEFIRRYADKRLIKLSYIYYQRWGFHQKQKETFTSTQIAKLFPFITSEKSISRYFEESIIDCPMPEQGSVPVNLLLVFYPPQKFDDSFDSWLKQKQRAGWKIIFFSDDSSMTRLPIYTVSTDHVNASEIKNAFEDELPEEWMDQLSDPLPERFRNLTLLKIARQCGDPSVINLFASEQNTETLWQQTMRVIMTSLSGDRFKIFVALYLIRTKVSPKFLSELLDIKLIQPELDYLVASYLIETNVGRYYYWMPIHLRNSVAAYTLIPPKRLLEFGTELLQRQISVLKRSRIPDQFEVSGFQYCVNELVQYGALDNPLQRNLQFGRKLSRMQNQPLWKYYPFIATSMELALLSRKKSVVHKTLFAILDMLDKLPLEAEIIEIYDWLLKTEEKARNWQIVSDIQVKKATLFARLDQKEKAINLLASAIELNNDIKLYANRYHNLISISLMLLDMGEFKKLLDIISQTDFDIKKLSEEDLLRLWLIDGHILFQEKKYNDAEKSFGKVINASNPPIPDGLMAKTYLNLADIHASQNRLDAYGQCLAKASSYFELAGNLNNSIDLHEKTADYYLSIGKEKQSISHLEWLFYYYREAGETQRARDLADQLGGLFFKLGDQDKSTDFYSIAQGI